jgi:hypothetical protein
MAGAEQFVDIFAMGTKGVRGPTNVDRIAVDAAGLVWISIKGAPYVQFGGFGASSDLGTLVNRSASIMGANSWAYEFDDLLKNALSSDWSVAGTWAQSTTKGPGVWTATSASPAVLSRTGGNPSLTVNPSVTPWHIAGRMLHVVALQVNDQKGICNGTVAPNTNGCGAGIRQGVSPTKYVFWAMKAGVLVSALSTVSIDTTAFHKIELWFDGLNMYGSVDNETPVLVTSAANLPTTATGERHGVEVGTGVGVDQFFDYFYCAAARTAG